MSSVPSGLRSRADKVQGKHNQHVMMAQTRGGLLRRIGLVLVGTSHDIRTYALRFLASNGRRLGKVLVRRQTSGITFRPLCRTAILDQISSFLRDHNSRRIRVSADYGWHD